MRKQFFQKLIIIGSLTLLLDIFLQYQLFLQHRQSKIAAVTSELSEYRANIESLITNDLLVIQGVVNYFTITPRVSQGMFKRLGEISTQGNNRLLNLTVAQDYIIRYVYPIKGNEKILGLDYRNLPDQWKRVKSVGKTGQMVILGPRHLIQGGYGLIGSMPVFRDNEENPGQLWGIVSAVIDIQTLLSDSKLKDSKLNIAIRGTNGQGEEEEIFYGDKNLFATNQEAITMSVVFPGGRWQLAGYPVRGWFVWKNPPSLAWLIHFVLFFFTLTLSYSTYRQLKKRSLLEQTQESLDESQAIAHLGSWRINFKNKKVWWSRECYHIFGKDPETYIPTFEGSLALMHPEDRDRIIQNLERTFKFGEPYAIDHRLKLDDDSVRHVQGRGKLLNPEEQSEFHIHGTLQDITERKLTELSLQNSQKLNHAIGAASLDPMITINSEDNIIFWNQMAEKMLGWTEAEALNQKLHQLIVPEDFRQQAARGFCHFTKTGDGPVVNKVLELVALRKDGSNFPVDLSVTAFQLNDQYFAHGILRDATQRKAAEKKLRQLATTDELTKISNRRHFMERADMERQRHQRYQSPLSLLLFDIDHFKRINDNFGHDVGDSVLKKIAGITTSILRNLDIFGRFGGEEFTIALPQTDIQGAQQLAERLRQLIECTPFQIDNDRHINLTVSIGVATLQPDDKHLDTLIKRADIALYQAKNNGRNQVQSAPGKRPE